MSEFRVTLVACVDGNPLKAWRGDSDPDDVWEEQTYTFGDLETAKSFLRGLPEQTTTHVKLLVDGEPIFDQDAGADHLDAAEPGVPMPHTVDSDVATDDDEIADAPPLVASQGHGQ